MIVGLSSRDRPAPEARTNWPITLTRRPVKAAASSLSTTSVSSMPFLTSSDHGATPTDNVP